MQKCIAVKLIVAMLKLYEKKFVLSQIYFADVDNCAVTSNRTVNINGQTVPQLVERSDCGEYGFCDSISDGFRCICYPGHEGSRCEFGNLILHLKVSYLNFYQ